ncbi:MAG: hypothetical protein ACLR6B_11220 [Blautia sp.]
MSYIMDLRENINCLRELNDKRKDAIGVLLSTYGEKAPFEIKDLVEEALSNLIDYYETKEFRDLNEDNHIRRDKTLTNLKELWKSWAKLTVGVEPKHHSTVASHFDLLYSTLNYNNASERKRRIKNILITLEDVYNILSEMLEIDRIIYLDDYISKTDEMNPLNHIKKAHDEADNIDTYYQDEDGEAFFNAVDHFIEAYDSLQASDIL